MNLNENNVNRMNMKPANHIGILFSRISDQSCVPMSPNRHKPSRYNYNYGYTTEVSCMTTYGDADVVALAAYREVKLDTNHDSFE
jgi:hypothetical protein